MSTEYRNHLYIWDLDRDDSIFHARAVIANLSSAAHAKQFAKAGRYALLIQNEFEPTEIGVAPFADIASLGESLRMLLKQSEAETGLEVFVQGLPDTVRLIQTVLAEPAASKIPIRVTFQPQEDGTKIGGALESGPKSTVTLNLEGR